MIWMRHRWILESGCGDVGQRMGEAYVECGSVADAQLERHFQTTREAVEDAPPARDRERLMKGWIRFG